MAGAAQDTTSMYNALHNVSAWIDRTTPVSPPKFHNAKDAYAYVSSSQILRLLSFANDWSRLLTINLVWLHVWLSFLIDRIMKITVVNPSTKPTWSSQRLVPKHSAGMTASTPVYTRACVGGRRGRLTNRFYRHMCLCVTHPIHSLKLWMDLFLLFMWTYHAPHMMIMKEMNLGLQRSCEFMILVPSWSDVAKHVDEQVNDEFEIIRTSSIACIRS